ncbi:hypothetical protein [Roseateles paludis]|jgi:hypothetical protein|uniref:Uncharacterized protein n=1 Tax=Roseateles paludis TaxID=3145238 RepID=A0ABV0FXD3_9BURK
MRVTKYSIHVVIGLGVVLVLLLSGGRYFQSDTQVQTPEISGNKTIDPVGKPAPSVADQTPSAASSVSVASLGAIGAAQVVPPKPRILLGSIADIYERALKQGGVRENVRAYRAYFGCSEVAQLSKGLGPTGFDGGGLEVYLPRAAARQEANRSLEALSNYCTSYQGADFLSRQREAGGREKMRPFLNHISVNAPVAERFPAIVGALSMPTENPLEFTLWASADLHKLLTSSHGLKDAQAGIVEALVVRQFVNDPGVLDFYKMRQCVVQHVCIEGLPPESAEIVAATPIANQISAQISRQDWSSLIYTPPPKVK